MRHLILLVFALLICCSHSWVLITSHKQVTLAVTKDVSLECKYDNQDNGRPPIDVVLGILIHKFHGTDQWLTTAKKRAGRDKIDVGEFVGPDAIVTGHLGDVQDTFLKVVWPVTSSNTTGQYACEVNGYAKDDSFITAVSNSVSIVKTHLTLQYLLTLVNYLKEQAENNRQRSSQAIYNVQELEKRVNRELDIIKRAINASRDMGEHLPNGRGELDKAAIGSIVDSKVGDNLYEKRNWPGGQYALLNTQDGCPNSTKTTWTTGYIKFHSESKQSVKFDAASQPNHLAKPVFEKNASNNFVYIRTCKRGTNVSGPAWPKGSYCIHRAGGFCPAGFQEGKVQMDPEDNPKLKADFQNPPDFQMDTSFQYEILYFCCRNDESPTTSIILPVETPFYLYRYKGTCQAIQGAKVLSEWLQISTENHANGDRFYSNIVPDSTLNPLRLQLCYYTN